MTLRTEKTAVVTPPAGVGLVLSGGGAKGAYQVGVLKCLAENGVRIAAVAGASVGALNGSVIASAPHLAEGAARLERIWRELADEKTQLNLSLDLLGFLGFLSSTGERNRVIELLQSFVRTIRPIEDTSEASFRRRPESNIVLNGLGIRRPIVAEPVLGSMIANHVSDAGLASGIPLYVSVFRSQGILLDVGWALAGSLGLVDTPKSEFLYVQGLAKSERRKAILASAALPLIFDAQQISGKLYADGGLGGLLRVQGNTPITPLFEHSRCRVVIVTHLSDGSLFDRHRHPEATLIEIRPRTPISRAGGLRDTLELQPQRIDSWIDQGYGDTKKHLQSISKALQGVSRALEARSKRAEEIRRLMGSE